MEGQAPHLEANAFEIERVHKYENTPKLWFTGPTTMRHGLNETETLWTDNKLMNRSGVQLRRLESSLLFAHSEEFVRMIMNGNSENPEYSAELILLLAWNIISPTTGAHMFPKIDPTATDNDVSCILYYFHPQWNAYIPLCLSDPAFQAICATTYTAMSLLRLFTKWPKSYIRSWNEIKDKFSASYGFEFPYRWYRPSKESLVGICLHFKSNIILKNGLTGILYMHEKSPMDRELRDYLFGHHLECFNLHAFPLFMSVGKNCNAMLLIYSPLLLTACPQQETALDCFTCNSD
ncbi:hypothetical protein J5N97_001445 [Dioscorea zingiberensis]|uniref:Uncharacterized protein n=1 Tax=Dioscorea zingiberensis TaxID=325984 RepID=A0A9D5BU51_9LILI|nr:hypothetical protein J5N97_001445 [Dioscorea zingiberensis]